MDSELLDRDSEQWRNELLDRMFPCPLSHYEPKPHSLWEAWKNGLIPEKFLKEALPILNEVLEEYPRQPSHSCGLLPATGSKSSLSATPDDESPWQQRAIRDMEDAAAVFEEC